MNHYCLCLLGQLQLKRLAQVKTVPDNSLYSSHTVAHQFGSHPGVQGRVKVVVVVTGEPEDVSRTFVEGYDLEQTCQRTCMSLGSF